ncbi:uncharacterized protein LOC130818358 [Amaranthus tricolor]|uniref:uncharacterized protein LOC130818358 n=1 Tax=Amaranthus tricolor TaxID=29722 RepID=UPI00258C50D1|nr:uncharacterized protein LOC130818358 [Amaranthus tricolor]
MQGVGQPVDWTGFVWNRSSIPKARFILWFAVNERLKSRDKLAALGLIPTDAYPVCGLISESHSHMFFACNYSFQCLRDILTWLGIRIPSDFLADFASRKWKCPTAKRKIATIALCSLTYEIWCARNDSIWNFKVPMVSRITISKEQSFAYSNQKR